MEGKKNACIVYVTSTKAELPRVRGELEKEGYTPCSVMATLDDARSAKDGDINLPEAVKACIEQSILCIFLLPKEQGEDEGIGEAACLAGQLGKRMIGLAAEPRTTYPEEFDVAGAIIPAKSTQLPDVIRGADVWITEEKGRVEDRVIVHLKCQ